MEQKVQTSEENWKWQRGITSYFQAYHSYARKFVANSVFFLTYKNGETRSRTQFVPKTKVKSRNGMQSAAKQKYAGRENNRGHQSAAKVKIMADMMRKIRADWTRQTVLWVRELLILEKRGSTRNGRIRRSNGKVGCKS